MTEAEIKKALVWHSNDETHCSGCPYEEHSVTHYCVDMVIQDALDLLNRQQAMIERLKDENLQSEYPARIRVDDFFVCANSLGEWLEFCDSLKAEAIKEFAERLKKCSQWLPLTAIPDSFVTVSDIDNLVKEMVGDAE